mmetsp:Transcript_3541/g.8827  ORF Transcript_3541/g.8827 Transcript_3541/m.8827 type:complete len:259 (-) Transcript_3541:859-1635(-)
MATEACCKGGVPASGDGSRAIHGQGTVLQLPLGGSPSSPPLPCYVTGSGEHAVIAVYDVFGFEVERTRSVCDQMARDGGFTVILPDFFRGTDVMKEFGQFPPKGGMAEVRPWLFRTAPFDVVIPEVLDLVVPYLKSRGAKKIGMVGFCWGGKITMLASAHDQIAAGVGIHSGLLTPEDAAKVRCPQMLLQAGNDQPVEPLWDELKKKPFFDKCRTKTYHDLAHGWALRSDMSDPVAGPLADEPIKRAIEFLNENMNTE